MKQKHVILAAVVLLLLAAAAKAKAAEPIVVLALDPTPPVEPKQTGGWLAGISKFLDLLGLPKPVVAPAPVTQPEVIGGDGTGPNFPTVPPGYVYTGPVSPPSSGDSGSGGAPGVPDKQPGLSGLDRPVGDSVAVPSPDGLQYGWPDGSTRPYPMPPEVATYAKDPDWWARYGADYTYGGDKYP